jgi:hypothetical protein
MLLLAAQVVALVASVRRRLWESLPAWTIYIGIVTIHVIAGVVLSMGLGREYPLSILYLEPALIMGQIAITFESSLKYLGITWRNRSPEGRLLLWMIPLVPTAIVLPMEFGFVRDALASWSNHEGESLRLVYAVRLFLGVTLLILFALVPVAARLRGTPVLPIAVTHHRIVAAYLAFAVFGYIGKSYVTNSTDLVLTIVFFVVGPVLCFAYWSRTMWNASPIELEPAMVAAISLDEATPFERHEAAFRKAQNL